MLSHIFAQICMLNNTCMYSDQIPGNKNKEKGNDSGLA